MLLAADRQSGPFSTSPPDMETTDFRFAHVVDLHVGLVLHPTDQSPSDHHQVDALHRLVAGYREESQEADGTDQWRQYHSSSTPRKELLLGGSKSCGL